VIGVAALPVYEMLRDEFGLSRRSTNGSCKYDHYFKNVHTLKRDRAPWRYSLLHERGTPQAIVSNPDRLVVNANMKALGLDWPTRSRSAVTMCNPAGPEPYTHAAWLLGVDPADCCVVEDS
jgi:beta-phosphoglucomutase-like phosphatase (HAD superfamily)